MKKSYAVYSADASSRTFFSNLLDIVRDFPQAHELGYRLFKRNLKAMYRQSFLGFGWVIVPPLSTAILWIFLRSNNIVSVGSVGDSYPVFVLTGTILWQMFNESILSPLSQVVENKAMLSKINIPREGLLLSSFYLLTFNAMVKLCLLALVYLLFSQNVKISSLVFVPLGLVTIHMAGFTIGLFLTPIGMLYQDINKGLSALLPFWMYLTPIVYPMPRDGAMGIVMKWNPLATLITFTRDGLMAKPIQDASLFGVYALTFFLLFGVALVMYRLSMPMIIERIGS